MRNLLVFLLCLWTTLSVWAAQQVTIPPNGQAKVKIARSDFTRIFVKGDRIQDVKGKRGQFNLETDKVSGQIYIAPTKQMQDRPISIFITTEKGQTYQLMMLPLPIPATSVEIDPTVQKNAAAKPWEESTPYVDSLTKLLVAMYHNHVPNGYEVNLISDAKPQWLGKKATVRLIKMYVGDHLRGEVYQIDNQMDHVMKLDAKQLYRPDAKLIALASQRIPPRASTQLYMVVNDE